MGGYSKIKAITTSPTAATTTTQTPAMDDHQTTKKAPAPTPTDQQESEAEEEQAANSNGELRRNFSTASMRFMKLDRQGSSGFVSSRALQGALRRAFSVRSSASSDKYSRIYNDGPVALGSPVADEDGGGFEEEVKKDVAKEKKRKGGRIFRACKRIFRL